MKRTGVEQTKQKSAPKRRETRADQRRGVPSQHEEEEEEETTSEPRRLDVSDPLEASRYRENKEEEEEKEGDLVCIPSSAPVSTTITECLEGEEEEEEEEEESSIGSIEVPPQPVIERAQVDFPGVLLNWTRAGSCAFGDYMSDAISLGSTTSLERLFDSRRPFDRVDAGVAVASSVAVVSGWMRFLSRVGHSFDSPYVPPGWAYDGTTSDIEERIATFASRTSSDSAKRWHERCFAAARTDGVACVLAVPLAPVFRLLIETHRLKGDWFKRSASPSACSPGALRSAVAELLRNDEPATIWIRDERKTDGTGRFRLHQLFFYLAKIDERETQLFYRVQDALRYAEIPADGKGVAWKWGF